MCGSSCLFGRSERVFARRFFLPRKLLSDHFFCVYYDCTSVVCYLLSAQEFFPSRLGSSSSLRMLSWKIGAVRPLTVTSRMPGLLSVLTRSFLLHSTSLLSLFSHFCPFWDLRLSHQLCQPCNEPADILGLLLYSPLVQALEYLFAVT